VAASYASGSGLGAGRPVETGRYQDGRGGYGQRARDGVSFRKRERTREERERERRGDADPVFISV